MTKAKYFFQPLIFSILLVGLFHKASAAVPANWSGPKPVTEVPLYRHAFPISIRNADNTVFNSFSMEIPQGWKITKDGLGYKIIQPLAQSHKIIPSFNFQCLPGDTYKIFWEKEVESAKGQSPEIFDFNGFKVLRKMISPYPGNKEFKTFSISIFRQNFTLRMHTYAENEQSIAPMIPILDCAGRSIELSEKSAEAIQSQSGSPAPGTAEPPKTPPADERSGGDSAKIPEDKTSVSAKDTKSESHGSSQNLAAVPDTKVSSTSVRDLVGVGENFQGDGTPDTRIYVVLPFSNAQAVSATLRSKAGEFSVWDTIPGNGCWSMGVNIRQGSGNLKNINNPDGSLKSTMLNGDVLFELCLHDVGAISNRQTDYQFEVGLADGGKITKNIASGELGNLPVNSDGSIQYSLLDADPFTGKVFKIAAAAFIPPHPSINSVGPYEEIKPDAEPDYMLSVEFFAEGKTLVNAAVSNTDGTLSAWDTVPGNMIWGLGVFVRNPSGSGVLQQNNPDSSLKPYLVKSAPEEISLRMTDIGAIRDKATSFKVVLSFSDGTSLTCQIGKPTF